MPNLQESLRLLMGSMPQLEDTCIYKVWPLCTMKYYWAKHKEWTRTIFRNTGCPRGYDAIK